MFIPLHCVFYKSMLNRASSHALVPDLDAAEVQAQAVAAKYDLPLNMGSFRVAISIDMEGTWRGARVKREREREASFIMLSLYLSELNKVQCPKLRKGINMICAMLGKSKIYTCPTNFKNKMHACSATTL